MVRANRACQRCLKDVTELNSCRSYAVESTDISVSKTEESRAMVRANGAGQRCFPRENRSDFRVCEVASKRVEVTSSGLEVPLFPK